MATISTLSFSTAINTKGWDAGIKLGSKAVDDFYARVGKKLGDLPVGKQIRQLASLGGTLAGIGHSAVAPLSGVGNAIKGVGSSATAAVGSVAKLGAGVVALGSAVGGGLLAFAVSGLNRIDQLTDAAQRIGVTTNALSELRYAANLTGSQAEDLDAALEKLNAGLGDTSEDGGKASDALKRIGLDSKALAKASPDEAFKQIVANFGKLEIASDRTRFAMDVFGKGGVKILNTLGAGGVELERLSAEARKFGVSISQVDAARVGVAKDSLDRAGAAVEGLGNQLAMNLAPYIEVVAGKFADWFASFSDGGATVTTWVDNVVMGVAWLLDGAASLQSSFTSAFASIAAGAAKVASFLPSFVVDSDAVKAIASDLSKLAAEQANYKPGGDLLASYDSIKEKARKVGEEVAAKIKEGLGANNPFEALTTGIDDLTKKLKEQIATFGMSAEAIEIWKLSQQGATAEQLKGVTALQRQYRGMDEAKKKQDELKDFAKEIEKSTRTPIQQAADQFKKLDAAFRAGLIDQKTLGLAKKDAVGGAMGDEKEPDEAKFAGATELGSTEAYSAIIRANQGQAGGDQLDVAKSSLGVLQQIAAAVRRDPAPAPRPALARI